MGDLVFELKRRGVALSTDVVLPRTMFEMVGEFHKKMGLPHVDDMRPHIMRYADFKYRVNFLFEELREFVEAHTEGDIVKAADALVDLAWIAAGTAHYMGVPFDEVLNEVNRANMQKRPWREGDPVKPRNYTAGEVVKPEGWCEPDVVGVIEHRRDSFLKM